MNSILFKRNLCFRYDLHKLSCNIHILFYIICDCDFCTFDFFFLMQSHDRAQRRLVKNSFVVELSDGHRKLRHLFLFNDVIACAKYKASGRDKFTFELKWYVPVAEATVTEDGIEPREASPANVVALR